MPPSPKFTANDRRNKLRCGTNFPRNRGRVTESTRAPAMRATLLTLALVCLAASAIATDLPDGQVVELNELTFDAGVAKGPTLVEVYADWCS